MLVIVLMMAVSGNAQRGQNSRSGLSPAPLNNDEEGNEATIDSTNISTYQLFNIDAKKQFKPKGLYRGFQQYDPSRQQEFQYGHLGNLSSASYPLVINLQPRIGLFLGNSQFDIYHKNEDDLIFFDQNTPFSELYFSGGESQAELRAKALFSRSFANNVNLVIDYDRISQGGRYQNQASKSTAIATSIAFRPEESRISLFLSYISNASYEEINGGVSDLTLFDSTSYQLRKNIPVTISDAEERYQNQNFIANVFYDFKKDNENDTTETKLKNNLQYEFNYFNEFFRFSDSGVSSDSSFYKNFFIDDRGLRNYAELTRLRNSIFLNSSYAKAYEFKTGITYDYNTVEIASGNVVTNEVYLRFKAKTGYKERMSIATDAYLGLLGVAGEFGIFSKLNFSITKLQGFNFSFDVSRKAQNFIYDQFYINNTPIWQNSETNKLVFFQSFSGEYYHQKLRFRGGAKLQTAFNYLYFGTDGTPQQYAKSYNLLLLYVKEDLKYKSILLENSVFFQSQNELLTNVPSFFTQNSLSFYGYVFKKKMLLKTGVDFRYIINDYLPAYNPVSGQFYLNTEIKNKPYPLLDVHASMKVSSFTAFVKYDNIGSFILPDVEFMVVNHPQFDARFRFGILWNLWN